MTGRWNGVCVMRFVFIILFLLDGFFRTLENVNPLDDKIRGGGVLGCVPYHTSASWSSDKVWLACCGFKCNSIPLQAALRVIHAGLFWLDFCFHK